MIYHNDKIKLPKGFIWKNYEGLSQILTRARTVTVDCSSFVDILYFTTGSAKYDDLEKAGLIERKNNEWFIILS